jgi:hypothetical protein
VSDSGSGSGSGGSGSGSGLPTSLAAAVALLVAALAAIGLTGDALLRAVRNEPGSLSVWFIVALAGAGLFAFAQLWPSRSPGDVSTASTTDTETTTSTTKTDTGTGTLEKSHTTTTKTETSGAQQESRRRPWLGRQWIGLAGLVILLAGVAAAVIVGATSISDRELPLVTLQSGSVAAAPTGADGAFAGGSIEVTVTVRAVGMTTHNDVLVQVLGLKEFTQVDEDAVTLCENNHTWNTAKNYVPLDDPTKAAVLLWNRIGPKSDGSVEATWKLQIPAGKYAALCAWSVFGGDLPSINPVSGSPSPVSGSSPGFLQKTSAAYLRLNLPTGW